MFKFDSQVDLNFLEFLTWELLPTSCQRSQVNLSTLHYNDKTFFKIRIFKHYLAELKNMWMSY